MIVNVPVSIGELVDKITILEIKKMHTNDKNKLKNINNELRLLIEIEKGVDYPKYMKEQLFSVNNRLWQIENDIRLYEKMSDFDEKFILLARLIYLYNDTRAEIKRNINVATGSHIIEEKIF